MVQVTPLWRTLDLLHNAVLSVAFTKGMQAVKHWSNKILQFLTRGGAWHRLTCLMTTKLLLFLHPRHRLRSIVMSMSVCVSVCLSARISLEPHVWSLPIFLCMLFMSVARSSSGMLTIGRITYRREGGDGSTQRGRSITYDCLVVAAVVIFGWVWFYFAFYHQN